MTESSEVMAVLTTFETEEDAARVIGALVAGRWIACGTIVPRVRSIYRWQGAVEDASEVLCVLKTRRDRLDALIEVLGERHPYEVPEIIALPVAGGGASYLEWVMKEAAADGG